MNNTISVCIHEQGNLTFLLDYNKYQTNAAFSTLHNTSTVLLLLKSINGHNSKNKCIIIVFHITFEKNVPQRHRYIC